MSTLPLSHDASPIGDALMQDFSFLFREFQHSFDPEYSFISQYLCTPTVEWYWKIWMMPTLLKVFSVLLVIFSFMVVWSEVTFFSNDPVLSIFAVFINAAARNYNYLCLEVSNHYLWHYESGVRICPQFQGPFGPLVFEIPQICLGF